MAPPAASTLPDIEDCSAPPPPAPYGSVAILDTCTGCMTCRVLAPSIFLEAKAASADPTLPTEVGRPLQSLEEAYQVRYVGPPLSVRADAQREPHGSPHPPF